jgi:hypothetical protein
MILAALRIPKKEAGFSLRIASSLSALAICRSLSSNDGISRTVTRSILRLGERATKAYLHQIRSNELSLNSI